MNCWDFLGIAPTGDESVIKNAYLSKLPEHHPEEDAAGFCMLRQALEDALKAASGIRGSQNETGSSPESSPMMGSPEVQDFIKNVGALYQDFAQRIDPAAWEKLISTPVCTDLETQKEAGWALLSFLMDHFYLPGACYQAMDRTFGWLDDQDDLCRHFPENFIDFLVERIEDDDPLRYGLFELREGFDYDRFIRTFFSLQSALNQHDRDTVEKLLAEMEEMHMDHPDLTLLRIRHESMVSGHESLTWDLARELFARDGDNPLTCYYYIRAAFNYEDYLDSQDISGSRINLQEIGDLIPRLLDHDSENASYWQLLGNYLRRTGDNSRALAAYRRASSLLDDVPEFLSRQITETALGLSHELEGDPDFSDLWHLANVCWLAHRYDRVRELLEKVEVTDDNRASWLFMMAGSCHELRDYNAAIFYRKKIWESFPDEERPMDLFFDLADDYEQIDDIEGALDIFRQAQEHFPGHPEFCFRHARLLYRQDQFPEAVKLCDQALESGFHRNAFQLRLEILLNMKEYQEICDSAENVISQGFRSAQLLYTYAKALRRLEKYDQAEELLKELAERTQEAAGICQEYADLCYDTDRSEEALVWIDKAIAQEDTPSHRFCKAIYLRDLKRYQEEADIYLGMIDLGANNYYIFYRLGRALESLERYQEAEQYYRRSLEKNASYGDTWDCLGDVLQDQGKWEDAAQAYEQGWRNGNRQAIRDLCRLMKRTHQNERAEEYLKRGLEEMPDDSSLLWIYSSILQRLKRFDEAIRCLGRYMEVKPGQTSSAYREIAHCYVDANDYAQAEAYYQRAIDHDPSDAKSWRLFGKYLANTRDMNEEALPYLEKAVELDPASTYGWLKLGEVYEALGRPEDAVRCYENSLKNYQSEIEEDPSDCCNYEGAADALIHLNRLDEAQEMLNQAFARQNCVFSCSGTQCYEGLEDIAKMEERRGNIEKAIQWMETAAQYSSNTSHYQKRIAQLKEKLSRN